MHLLPSENEPEIISKLSLKSMINFHKSDVIYWSIDSKVLPIGLFRFYRICLTYDVLILENLWNKPNIESRSLFQITGDGKKDYYGVIVARYQEYYIEIIIL